MIEQVGFMDVASIVAQRDTCMVLPTPYHAVALWPQYVYFLQSVFDHHQLSSNRVILRDTHTHLRLWIPGQMYLRRRDYKFVSPYGRRALWH